MILRQETPPEITRIHTQALAAADGFRKAEAALIDALMEVEHKKVFLKLGYSSLFTYATQALRLPEGAAYNAITVARKAREIPELKTEIQAGLSIAKARKVVPVLAASANPTLWLEKARTLSTRQLEKEVARENPREATPERASYVSEKRLDLRLGVSEKLMLQLRRAQDQVSRSKARAVSLEETLEVLTGFYLQRQDPLEKAKRAVAKKGLVHGKAQPARRQDNSRSKLEHLQPARALAEQGHEPTSSLRNATVLGAQRKQGARLGIHQRKTYFTSSSRDELPDRRAPIPSDISHTTRFRDQGRCQFRVRPDGPICGESRWVELHHIKPVSQGGVHSAENLVILCRSHHADHHQTQ